MKKVLIAIVISLALCYTIHAQTINKIEYFIDTDKGIGKNKLINVTAFANASFPFTVSLTGVTAGNHKLYIRARDSKGKWSIAARQTIQVLPTNNKKVITAGEYFFDTDNGFGKGKRITVSNPDSILLNNFTATITGLQPGYHKMYTRFIDNFGNWSQTTRYNVQVKINTGNEYIVEVEYFFTKDAGVGKCSSVALVSSSDSTYTFYIPAENIPSNAKKVFVRVKDSSDNSWSFTRFKPIQVSNALSDMKISNLDNIKASVSIYPNPANTYFNISTGEFDDEKSITVYIKNVFGHLVLTKKFAATSQKQINISSFAKGIYFITVTANTSTSTQKLIIQ